MNHTRNRRFVISLLCLCVLTSSCKKVIKEVTEKMAKGTAKEMVEASSEKGLKTMSKKALKKLDWDELFKLIEKENINVAQSISRLDAGFQRSLWKAFQNDPETLIAVLSSNTLLDEFSIFTKNAPKLASNINVFRTFAKSDLFAKRTGKTSMFNSFVAREDGGLIRFIDSKSSSIVASYRNGVFSLIDPFKKGTKIIDETSLLKNNLVPNSIYKIRGGNGMQYMYNIDDLGRISSVEARNISPDEVILNIVNLNNDTNLGVDWGKSFAKIKQVSKGDDITISYKVSYLEDKTTPSFAHVDVTIKNKNVVSQTYKNLDEGINIAAFSAKDNAQVVKKYAAKLGISADKENKLLQEMMDDEGLAKLIQDNPEFNIKRWMIARRPVNKTKVAKINGRAVVNGNQYAGKNFFFNPHLNRDIKAKLDTKGLYNNSTYEQLVMLDKKYPNGIPFTENGYPDFINANACYKKDNKVLKVTLPNFTGDRTKDNILADNYLKSKGTSIKTEGYTWHHMEGNPPTMVLVDADVHSVVKHSGGHSIAKTNLHK